MLWLVLTRIISGIAGSYRSHHVTMSTSRSSRAMCKLPSSFLIKFLIIVIFLSSIPQKSDAQFEDWCIADEQTPDEELQKALDWACGNGADCTKTQAKQPCYLPNTVKDHASYAFNSYYQKLKHKGASCYFNSAAVLTALNPSHGPCKFDFLP